MARIALAIYLMLVTVAGPGPCCCTTTRIMAQLAHAACGEQFPPGPRPSCCSHCPLPGGQQGSVPGNTPGKGQPPGRPECPCRQHLGRVLAMLASDRRDSELFQQRYLVQGLTKILF